MSVNNLTLDVGQANNLKLAFGRNGWNNAEINMLSEGNVLSEVLQVIKGMAEIKIIKHEINCDADPMIPDDWSIEEHNRQGLLNFSLDKVSLYRPKKQHKGLINGYNLRQELIGKNAMNANVLDYLLVHPELIPDAWKNFHIFFWGTIYRHSPDNISVRYLCWRGRKWRWFFGWPGRGFDFNHPAIIKTS